MIDYLRVREELQTSVDSHQIRFLIRDTVVLKDGVSFRFLASPRQAEATT
jgi:hypothetical protein